MRRLITAMALIAAPIAIAAADEEVSKMGDSIALPEALPEQMTPESLALIAGKLDKLSRFRLVQASGGRSTAEKRRADAVRTKSLAVELQTAADALKAAQDGNTYYTAALKDAEISAMATTQHIASEIGHIDLSRELFELLEGPPPSSPEPITYVFCMEASGPGPRTFARYAPEALVQSIPYVQGYLTHNFEQTAPKKLRLELTVEHDADAAPFAAIDALQAANAAAFAEMSDEVKASTRAAETILMGDLAERLCSPTPPRGQ